MQSGHHFYQLYPNAFVLIALVPSCVIAIGIRIGIGLFQLRPWARTLRHGVGVDCTGVVPGD